MPDATDLTAYLTAILAALTYVMARSANQQAVAATAQAEAAKTQVEAAHRPVVVPFQKSAENVTFRGGQTSAGSGPQISENPPDRPDLPRYSAAFLPVENVGMGPALNVRGDFTSPRGAGTTRFATEAIAVGNRGVVAFETWTGESLSYTGNDQSVSAVLEYDDVAGRTYRTRVTFDVGSNAPVDTRGRRASRREQGVSLGREGPGISPDTLDRVPPLIVPPLATGSA